jgi:hypothetical protein
MLSGSGWGNMKLTGRMQIFAGCGTRDSGKNTFMLSPKMPHCH